MKNLRKFETEAKVKMFVQPNVVLVSDTGEVKYNVPMPSGVFVQHIDGSLWNRTEWTANGFTLDQVNGIAVIDENAKFVIAKTNIGNYISWSSNSTTLIDGVYTSTNKTTAQADYGGADNTALIAATDISEAAYLCANYTFPNGQQGYLPSLGELTVVLKYKNQIGWTINAIGAESYYSNNYWSSTQYDATRAWVLGWSTASAGVQEKGIKGNTYVRAFAALII